MRKFRAWDKYRNLMLENHTFNSIASTGLYNVEEHLTWMQFTGLFDKNGKEIYEGDLVKYWYTNVGDANDLVGTAEVIFHEGCFSIQIEKDYIPCLCLMQSLEVEGDKFTFKWETGEDFSQVQKESELQKERNNILKYVDNVIVETMGLDEAVRVLKGEADLRWQRIARIKELWEPIHKEILKRDKAYYHQWSKNDKNRMLLNVIQICRLDKEIND